MAPAGEEHGVKNHTGQRLKVLVFVAPNPSKGVNRPGYGQICISESLLTTSDYLFGTVRPSSKSCKSDPGGEVGAGGIDGVAVAS